ncbi:hypothetical protein GWI33_011574 [Rhynchophorus ferrugineus]|uniref:Uncharacterized protein n=1 Tax=Rhynchophorus ferrugineus TaxID=354439 RepID=A0A834I6V8_RHYFE|nr:hypothetical protein GWI33_011574 [Rhynchophorus ferrugineus]
MEVTVPASIKIAPIRTVRDVETKEAAAGRIPFYLRSTERDFFDDARLLGATALPIWDRRTSRSISRTEKARTATIHGVVVGRCCFFVLHDIEHDLPLSLFININGLTVSVNVVLKENRDICFQNSV